MQRRFLIFFSIAALSFALSTNSWAEEKSPSPILLELFTSEGCSSCPPADRLLTQIAESQPVAEAKVVTLEFHIDYWDRLGWKDPFSMRESTRRQYDYAQALKTERVYTPQMVVDGRYGFMGADSTAAQKVLEAAVENPKAEIRLVPTRPENKTEEADIILEINIAHVPDLGGRKRAAVMMAITEDGLSSEVKAGENDGKRLEHTSVVRAFESVSRINPKNKGGLKFLQPIKLDKNWKRENLGAVVFIQDRDNRGISGVASISLAE